MPGLLLGVISPWASGPIVFAVWSIGLIVVMRIAYSRLRQFSRRTKTHLDDIIIKREDLMLFKRGSSS
jgi:hypothetical protein